MAGRGVFSAWNDPREFDRVYVDPECGTVCWPGNLDLDPDVLYCGVTGKPLPGVNRRANGRKAHRARRNGGTKLTPHRRR
jgi:hypothetical protein